MDIFGRKPEQGELQKIIQSTRSEFIVVYGRRRVGKTFLIKEYFKNRITFQTSGLESENIETQLAHFTANLKQLTTYEDFDKPKNWMEAFRLLTDALALDKSPVKIIFIDELPWMDTRASDLSAAIDYFWNSWAGSRSDIKFIVCGSAASWMINQFLKNKKGFYNRVTHTLKLQPFSLSETEDYLKKSGFDYNHYQIIQIYMALGGIPFYLNQLKTDESPSQNINRLFFGQKAKLREEFSMLFKSLFKNYKRHLTITDALFKKKKGLSREEISRITKIKNGGSLSALLGELDASDFIIKYALPGKINRNSIYRLSDNFVLFYNYFIAGSNKTDFNFWINAINSPTYYSWAGLAFENICIQHSEQLKKALGIQGIQSSTFVWSSSDTQIDMIIERKDGIINLFEMKFSETEYQIDPEYDKKLREKISLFKEAYKTKKAIWFVLVTTYGLSSLRNSTMINKVITMDELFT